MCVHVCTDTCIYTKTKQKCTVAKNFLGNWDARIFYVIIINTHALFLERKKYLL